MARPRVRAKRSPRVNSRAIQATTTHSPRVPKRDSAKSAWVARVRGP
jgi:hypothetical protein